MTKIKSRANPTLTIKDLAKELGLSITTISRALNGYSDVSEDTRKKVASAAKSMGYRPNRNAQRLVTRRTHNIGWVQPDNERKFLDPHFVEVMAGVLRGARAARYDVVMTSDTPERELAVYDRYVNDNSVDGFIIDLPRENDPRIAYLLEAGRPFVVHGRSNDATRYSWVDVDNYGNFYRLTRLLLTNGHSRIAFVNGDEQFNYALYRRRAVEHALIDHGLGPECLTVYNSLHPMGNAGFKLTQQVLEDGPVSAIIYSSILMAVEGNSALIQAGRQVGPDMTVASMDDELHYLDLSQLAGQATFVRSSLRDAGITLTEELARLCEQRATPRGTIMPSTFHLGGGLKDFGLTDPLPAHRQG